MMYSKVFKYHEKRESYYKIELSPQVGEAVSLHGYFQSLRYFHASSDTLRRVFTIPGDLERYIVAMVPEVLQKKSVTLHVRRGDYVALNDLYNSLNLNYYLRALQLLGEVSTVIIVSDDLSWCEKELVHRIPFKVILSPFRNPLLDFVLLHLGRRIIIANSSFSWWSAYLKTLRRQDGAIVAPYPWYNVSGRLAALNGIEFYPDWWRLVQL